MNYFSPLGSLPENLRQVSKDIIPLDLCNNYWQAWFPISNSKFCTRVENGRDSCKTQSYFRFAIVCSWNSFLWKAMVTVVQLLFVMEFKSVSSALARRSAAMELFRLSTFVSKSQQFAISSQDLWLFETFDRIEINFKASALLRQLGFQFTGFSRDCRNLSDSLSCLGLRVRDRSRRV